MEFYVIALVVIAACLLRVLLLLFKILTSEFTTPVNINKSTLRTIVCVGSGGHTTEMLRLISTLNATKYKPRLYILADNDFSSEVKILNFETYDPDYALSRIPRSRKVNQTYFSSVFSTLHSTLRTVSIVYKFKPDVILCNGPGTCIPVCIVAFLLKCFFLSDCRIVFIESLCRVRTLSLSGKILQYFADIFIVQWPHLRDACYRSKYYGRLT